MTYQEQIQTHKQQAQENQKVRERNRRRVQRWGLGLVILLLIGGGSAVILEQAGVTNVVPSFGQGGRPAWQLGFWHLKDVPDSLTEAPYIQELVDQGVISGYPDDNFKPQQLISRAEFAAMIDAAFLTPADTTTVAFEDVPEDFWGHDAIANTVAADFFVGYGDNTFQPNQPITKGEALQALQQGFDLGHRQGLLEGQPGTASLSATQPLTRADAAVLIYQTLDLMQQKQ
jgi:hypothetical protein